jgi:hypothetical protein
MLIAAGPVPADAGPVSGMISGAESSSVAYRESRCDLAAGRAAVCRGATEEAP